MKSQSPQIGASLRTQPSPRPQSPATASQSPQIGASLRTLRLGPGLSQGPGLNPLKSGQAFGRYQRKTQQPSGDTSQSPQIGASLRTEYKGLTLPMGQLSQSPQIGASLRTSVASNTARLFSLSQSPQIGASLRTHHSHQKPLHIFTVSIPSNRGKPSDSNCQGCEEAWRALSQSPQIGASLRTRFGSVFW